MFRTRAVSQNRRRSIPLVPLLAVGALLGLAACAARPAPAQPAGPDNPSTDTSAGFSLPLAEYAVSEETFQQARRASFVLIRTCMARFGVSFPVPPESLMPTVATNGRRYGIIDGVTAVRVGYADPNEQERQRAAAELRSRMGSSTSEQDWLLTGRGEASFHGQPVPEGGCAGEANRKLEQGAPAVTVPGQLGLPFQLEVDALAKAQADPRMHAVFRDWSTCMQRRGFQYAGPDDAAGDSRWTDATYKEKQIATATADVACRDETGLVARWHAAEVEYQVQAIRDHAQELSEWKRYKDVYTKNVLDVLKQN